MKYRIVICDDEEMILKVNQLYLQEIAKRAEIEIEILTCKTGEEVFRQASKGMIHIAFLDIDMGNENGIQIAVELKKQFPDIQVIFITGHKEFALSAFEVEAIGYLVKPIDPAKLEHQLKKAVNLIILSKNRIARKTLLITEENVKKKLPQYKIKYIEKQGNRCVIYMLNSVHYTYCSIGKMLEELDDYFVQINQGFIVNRDYVAEIIKNEVVLKNNVRVAMGRKFARSVKESYFA
ncbi:two-component response regulator [Lachnospiraceae bacterium KM106-2]|nr:two-component response regulator [Lachnospiraceae bacterium KM106-2]